MGFIMDYVPSLENLTGVVTLTVETDKELRSRIPQMKRFYPAEAGELSQLLAICNNDSCNHREVVVTMTDEPAQGELEVKIVA